MSNKRGSISLVVVAAMLAAPAFAVGCGDDDDGGHTDNAAGEAGSSSGGTTSGGTTSGGTSAGGANSGGSSHTGGTATTGGTQPGGAANTGGSVDTGGTPNTAGTAGAGAASDTGGTQNTGGNDAGAGGATGGGMGGEGGIGGEGASGGGGPAEAGAGGAAGEGGSGGEPVVYDVLDNPDFEIWGATKDEFPGWEESGDVAASYLEWGDAHTGDTRLTHWTDASAYEVETYQTLDPIANGTYTLSVWVHGGAFTSQYLFARGHDAGAPTDELKQDIVPSESWVQVTLADIPVSSGQITIGVHSAGASGAWASFDSVTLTLQE